jgi:uncharacterized membrane protein
MLMFIVSNLVGSTIQITTLPLPVLSTLQAVCHPNIVNIYPGKKPVDTQQSGLVFNSICASIILSEPFTRYSLVGTILVAIGALIIGTFGSLTEPSHNLDQLLLLLGRRQFLLWLWGTAVAVILIIIGTWSLQRLYPRPTPRLRLVRGMLFGCISGILSAHSLLVAKTAVELLVRTIVDRHNEFNRWQSWIILVGLVGLALTQLYYMHRGLKLCSTSVLYPLVFCIYNIIAILDGLIYFHQSSRLSTLHAGLIALGTAILLSGVLALSWRLDESTHEPSSPIMHIKNRGRVPTPSGALIPGMGLVHPTMSDEESVDEEDEDLPDFLHSPLIEHPFDEESGFAPPRAKLPNIEDSKRKRSVNESTPLLRATTSPVSSRTPRSKKQKPLTTASPQLSPSIRRPTPRRRRMTISQEAGEIWDELNDREDPRYTGSLWSQGRRSADLERPRPRSGTLPVRRRDTSWANQFQRRSWWEGMNFGAGAGSPQGKSPVIAESSTAHHEHGDEGEDTDASMTTSGLLSPDGRSGGGEWGFGDQRRRSRQQDGLGDWFRLKWWRKRWREGAEEPRHETDDDGHGERGEEGSRGVQ